MQFLYHPAAVACSHIYTASKVRRAPLVQCDIKSSSVFLSRYPNFMLLQKLLSVWGSYISSHANVGQTYRHFPELRLSYSHFGNSGEEQIFNRVQYLL